MAATGEIMNNLWMEFRSAPSTYFQSSRTTPEDLVTSMFQVLTSEKKDSIKLVILGVWQETCHILFNDTERLTNAIEFLKDFLAQHKSVASSLVNSQILCTITTLLIEMEILLPSHDKELANFICILFDYIEKMKLEANHLMKSVACDCLRELEMRYPGLLVSKIGHFYGMSVAENSYIHQHYMALFATVLDHTVQKFLLEEAQEETASPLSENSLTDLLSYGEPLKAFKVAKNYKETASIILRKETPRSTTGDVTRFNEVKRGVSFILDWSRLFTPSCLVSTSTRLISCVEFTGLSPKILKRLFQYAPCQDIRLFQLILLLKNKFGSEICDETDEANLRKSLLVLSGQVNLPDHHRVLIWEWLLQWPRESSVINGEQVEDEGSLAEHNTSYEVELKQRVLQPSIFDSLELFFCKCKALCQYEDSGPEDARSLTTESFGPISISDMVVNLLPLVQCGVIDSHAVTLYRVLYTKYILHYQHHTSQRKEIEKLVMDLVLKNPKLIPNTIDFISTVQASNSESLLPLNLMSQMTQFLVSAPLSELLPHFPLYLMFIKHASAHPLINPVVMLQLLSRVLSESSLCAQGLWDLGNTLMEVCTTIMRVHGTESLFKELSDLLQLIAENYDDLDIRDRARFYHQLMLTVSGDKLSAILTLVSDSMTGSSLSDIVEARISSTVFPSAPSVRTIDEGSAFISLQRVSNVRDDSWKGYRTVPSSEEALDSKEVFLQSLESRDLNNNQHPIELTYRINLFKKPQGVSSMIYALVLKLSSNQHYHDSPDVYIPFLSFDGNGFPSSTASKLITLTFYPKEPVPAEFNLNAMFSSEEGVTYSTTLSPVSLNFTDLFLPVPMYLQEKVPADVIFSSLWDYIESTQQSNSGAHGVLSTVHLDSRMKDWESSLSKMLRIFETFFEDEAEGNHRIMIFLPPCYHLLLKFRPSTTGGTNVAIATDNWRLLPQINTLLQNLAI